MSHHPKGDISAREKRGHFRIGLTKAEDVLGEVLKEGARRLLTQAIEAEVAELRRHANQTVDGKRAVVRNGYLPEHSIQTELGEVPVKVPKVRDRSGQGVKFKNGERVEEHSQGMAETAIHQI